MTGRAARREDTCYAKARRREGERKKERGEKENSAKTQRREGKRKAGRKEKEDTARTRRREGKRKKEEREKACRGRCRTAGGTIVLYGSGDRVENQGKKVIGICSADASHGFLILIVKEKICTSIPFKDIKKKNTYSIFQSYLYLYLLLSQA